ncbi:MAG TPA: transglutaminase domain-containing protein, partial [Hymenobacter sp.]|nr:transglutaminase domain-containing protein [Hymenobacter sp.]
MTKLVLYRLALLILLGSASVPALGQADPIKFGKPDLKDFDPKNFVADSAAEAVVLCDFGRSRFEVGAADEGFRTVFERTTRIKILKKSGYDWATVEVPLYHKGNNEEKLSSLRGFTYNMVNGQVVKEKLESSATFREESGPNVTTRKFTLPNVREGAVIEYSYSVVSDFLFNFQDWQFQHSIPVRWSEYRAQVPEYFDYKIMMQGYVPLAVSEHPTGTTQFIVRWSSSIEAGLNGGRTSGGSENVSAQVTNHRWATQNVPAFRNEPFMTSARDYVSRIDFELAGFRWPNQGYKPVTDTWQGICDQLLNDESFGVQLRRGGFLKDQLTPLLAKEKDPAARVAAIHALVRKAVKYDGNDRLYSQTTVRKAYDQHRGNAADVNLLLIAALREAGFQANPVVLSTRDHGLVNRDFMPMLSRFNYVVAHVPLPEGKEMLVDATEELVPCGMLPARCLNGSGRLIMPKEADSRWISLAPKQRITEYQQIQLTLDATGGYTGKIHAEHSGYAGLAQRNQLRDKGEKKFVEEMLQGREGWSIAKYQFAQRDALDKPLSLDYEVRVAGGDAPAGTLYLRPFQYFGNSKNPFVHEQRQFPVDFGCAVDETLMLTLTLPTGY